MIVRSKPSFKDIAFNVSGSVLPRIAGRLAAIAIISVIAVLAAQAHPGIFAHISTVPFTLIGIALSVFMSFRNNACYARWWEGRQLWGELIISARSLARQTSLLPDEDRRYLIHGICGFACGLTARLRSEDEIAAIEPWISVGVGPKDPNATNTVLDRMGRRLLSLMQEGVLNPLHYSVLETEIRSLSKVQAACERISTTPVPFAYSLLLHRTALVFCVMLPFSLAGSLDWWTVVPALLTAYTFFGLDALGHELESPFGVEPNCLPLYALKRTIEREMLSLMGECDLPELLQPRKSILS